MPCGARPHWTSGLEMPSGYSAALPRSPLRTATMIDDHSIIRRKPDLIESLQERGLVETA